MPSPLDTFHDLLDPHATEAREEAQRDHERRNPDRDTLEARRGRRIRGAGSPAQRDPGLCQAEVGCGPDCYSQVGAVPEPEREEMHFLQRFTFSYKDLSFFPLISISILPNRTCPQCYPDKLWTEIQTCSLAALTGDRVFPSEGGGCG